MELEIQARQVVMDSAWRDLIEQNASRLAARYPEVLRLHLTLRHTAHHRSGLEGVAILANVEGATLRADKEKETVPDALHAAFEALAVELERHHRERRHVTKSPGARMQGSIKRIFRSGGYGFIHFEPGRDVYFHRAALRELNFAKLRPGDPVEFEVEQGQKGLQAPRVFPVGERGNA